MRLLNTKTIELDGDEFSSTVSDERERYAILSHTWSNGEVSLQELKKGDAHFKPGYKKLAEFCKKALADGFSYAWIDTCCIDKQSSAELSEAINSMFTWYERSGRCYVYLADVTVDALDRDATMQQIRRSRWFTRGWTLQELLAPRDMVFYDQHWQTLGTKEELRDLLQDITTISDIDQWEDACIAQKFSWAANRQTTRVEDIAYCLLGIFGVNMPLLYGEGLRAFTRLQMEIIQRTEDESIFAWGSVPDRSDEGKPTSLFAISPANFADCTDVHAMPWDETRPHWSTHNQGFELQAYIYLAIDFRLGAFNQSPTYIMPLNCRRRLDKHPLSIVLKLVSWESDHAVGSAKYQRLTLRPRSWLTANHPSGPRSTLIIPHSFRTMDWEVDGVWPPKKTAGFPRTWPEGFSQSNLVVTIAQDAFRHNGFDMSTSLTWFSPPARTTTVDFGAHTGGTAHRTTRRVPAKFRPMNKGIRLFGQFTPEDGSEAGPIGGAFDSDELNTPSCLLFRGAERVLFEWQHGQGAIRFGIVQGRDLSCAFYSYIVHTATSPSVETEPPPKLKSPVHCIFHDVVVKAEVFQRHSTFLGPYTVVVITAGKDSLDEVGHKLERWPKDQVRDMDPNSTKSSFVRVFKRVEARSK